MKRNLLITISAFAAIASLFSCQKEQAFEEKTDPSKVNGSAIMTVNAGEIQTKTYLEADGSNYNVFWSKDDQIAAYEVGGSTIATTKTVSTALAANAASASFTMDFSGNTSLSPSFSYLFVYPSNALTQSGEIYRGRIKNTQTFTSTSFDKTADLMISEAVMDQATRPTSVNVAFTRVGATVLMNLKAPTTSETIQSIEFSTTQGNIAGYVKVYPLTGTFDTDIYSGQKNIILTPASATTYTGTIPVWFRCAAIDLNTDFTVTVHTSVKSYTKTVDLAAASKTIKFENAALTKINVDMSSASAFVHMAAGTEITSIFPAAKNGVKFTYAKGSSTTNPSYANPFPWYKNSTVTISGGTTGNITKVVFNYSSTPITAANMTTDVDGSTYTLSGSVGTWTVGATSATSVTFTNGEGASRITSVDVYYTGTPNEAKPESTPTLAFASATAEVAMGTPVTLAASSNYAEGTITYTSLNTGIATVDSSTGEVTPVAVGGPVTIRASITGATTAYSVINPTTADCAVTVTTSATWDVIDYALTGLGKSESTAYADWSGKAGSYSDAIYAGNSYRLNEDTPWIQIRASGNSGIVSTTSGGALKRVRVNSWSTAGTNANSLTIYGKNAPYTSTAELYSSDPYIKGTSLGTITAGSTDWLSISNSYEYIGIVSTSGSKYLFELDVEWQALKDRVNAPSSVSASVSGTTINVDWTNAASDVAGYIVTCTGETSKYIDDGSHTASFTGLANGDYTITIQSVPSDPANNAYSTITTKEAKVTAAVAEVWKLTPLADVTSTDVFVFAAKYGTTYYALGNNNGTSTAPSAPTFTVETGGGITKIKESVTDDMKWHLTKSESNYTFYPGTTGTSTWLYANTSNGNSIRVGTGDRKTFTVITEDPGTGYFKNTDTNRLLGVYRTNPDWRNYALTGTPAAVASNIADQTFYFFVLQP